MAVETATASQRDVPTIVRATGTFVADETSDVTPQVSGQVSATPVNVGDAVEAGQIVVRLDDRDARLKLDQVQASLRQVDAQAQQARAEAARNLRLAETGLIPKSDIERLNTQVATGEAAVAQVRAQVAIAQKTLEDMVIRAPFAGHVTARTVAPGESVTPATKVITIVRIQPIKLQLQVPQSDAVRLRTGLALQADLPAYPGVAFRGAITALNVAIDPGSRTMMIEATFANHDGRLTPGMSGSAEVYLSTTEPAVFVPAAAIVKVAGGTSSAVYVVEGERAQVRIVQPGAEQQGLTRIQSGLKGGEVIATTNTGQLFDGATVRTTVASAGASGAAPGSR